jgi:enamine deaminase RidA (YjgF/YER057c/UK114 family)
MEVEKRCVELGLDVPDFAREGYYGTASGLMKPFHIVGKVLFLSGHVPQRGTQVMFPGRLGATLTIEQGREAARLTGINVIGGIKQAAGDLDRVKSIVRTLNFVVCTPEFTEVHQVTNGFTDLLAEVFGPERGIGARATIGAMALSSNHCFETWVTVELR